MNRLVERNAAFLLASRVVAAATSVGVLALSAHRLDTAEFGVVVSVLAAGFVANTIVTFGSDTVVTRAVARNPGGASTTVGAALRLQLQISIALVAGAGFAVAMGASVAPLVQAVALVPLAIVTITGAVLRGRETMGPLAMSAVAASAVTVAATLVGFGIGSGPVVPVLAFALGSTTSAIVQRRATGRLGSTDRTDARDLLREAAPFAGMLVLAAVAAQGGVLLVEVIGDEPSGGYGAAARVLEAARLIPAAFVGAWFPHLVSTGDDRPSRRWIAGLAAYGFATSLAIALAAPLIDRVLFDSQPDGVAAIRLLGLSLPLVMVRLVLSSVAIADGREHTVLYSAVAGTIVLLVGGLSAVGRYGIPGVAVAQILGVAVSVVWLTIDQQRSVFSG